MYVQMYTFSEALRQVHVVFFSSKSNKTSAKTAVKFVKLKDKYKIDYTCMNFFPPWSTHYYLS